MHSSLIIQNRACIFQNVIFEVHHEEMCAFFLYGEFNVSYGCNAIIVVCTDNC